LKALPDLRTIRPMIMPTLRMSCAIFSMVGFEVVGYWLVAFLVKVFSVLKSAAKIQPFSDAEK
jgi:hypothetical protein